ILRLAHAGTRVADAVHLARVVRGAGDAVVARHLIARLRRLVAGDHRARGGVHPAGVGRAGADARLAGITDGAEEAVVAGAALVGGNRLAGVRLLVADHGEADVGQVG